MQLVSVSRGEMLDETSLPNPHKVLAKHHHLRGGQLGSANWRAWSVKYAASARFTETFALSLALR